MISNENDEPQQNLKETQIWIYENQEFGYSSNIENLEYYYNESNNHNNVKNSNDLN